MTQAARPAMRYLAAALALFATPAMAAPLCMAADPADFLSEKYGEVEFATGIRGQSLTHFYADPDDGSWTISVEMPNGVFCLMMDGSDFEFDVNPPKPKDEDS